MLASILLTIPTGSLLLVLVLLVPLVPLAPGTSLARPPAAQVARPQGSLEGPGWDKPEGPIRRFKRRAKSSHLLPEFSAEIGNITAVLGRDVRLVCTVENLGQYQVSERPPPTLPDKNIFFHSRAI